MTEFDPRDLIDEDIPWRADRRPLTPIYAAITSVAVITRLDDRTLVRFGFTEIGTNTWTVLDLDRDQAELLARTIYDALEEHDTDPNQ
jgi:hypothetical protein